MTGILGVILLAAAVLVTRTSRSQRVARAFAALGFAIGLTLVLLQFRVTNLESWPLLVCTAILGVWVRRATLEARQGRTPRLALLGLPGVFLLYYGLSLDDAGALIGTGAALLLIPEFTPGAYVRARPGVRARHHVDTFDRWRGAREPDTPDFEVHLEATGARLVNVGASTVYLHGWSPASVNGWLKLRADDGSGAPVTELKVGASARLSPWTIPNSGVRVWYTRADVPDAQWIFRVDWQEPTRPNRELN